MTNSHVPVIQVSPNAFYAVDRGRLVHRRRAHGTVDDRHVGAAGDLHDPAVVADPLRDLRAHLRGNAAGRVRRLHAGLSRHGGRAVRHRRLRHRLRVLAVDRQRLVSAAVHLRRRGGADLQPVRRLHVRLRDGPRDRGVDGAVLGRRVLPPGVLGRLSAAARPRAPTSTATGATRRTPARARWYAGGGVAGTTASGNYYNSRTGTSGSYNAGRQYNAWTGNATRGYDRTINGAAGGSGNVARASNYNTYTGQRSTANAASGTGAGGSTLQPRRRDDRGTARRRARRRRLDVQRARPARPTPGARRQRRQQPLRRRQRQRLQEHRRRLAAAFVQRLGQRVAATRRGRHANRRRASTGDDQIRRLQRSEPDVADEQRRRRLRRRWLRRWRLRRWRRLAAATDSAAEIASAAAASAEASAAASAGASVAAASAAAASAAAAGASE